MSASPTTGRDPADTRSAATYAEEPGAGWVSFAGVMLMIVGTINFIGGIAAIDDSTFYAGDTKLIFDDLNTWGWVLVCTGLVQILAAVGIWARNTFATILGIAFASLNAVVQLLMISAFPLWSLAILAIDILIIYGLLAYGGRMSARA